MGIAKTLSRTVTWGASLGRTEPVQPPRVTLSDGEYTDEGDEDRIFSLNRSFSFSVGGAGDGDVSFSDDDTLLSADMLTVRKGRFACM